MPRYALETLNAQTRAHHTTLPLSPRTVALFPPSISCAIPSVLWPFSAIATALRRSQSFIWRKDARSYLLALVVAISLTTPAGILGSGPAVRRATLRGTSAAVALPTAHTQAQAAAPRRSLRTLRAEVRQITMNTLVSVRVLVRITPPSPPVWSAYANTYPWGQCTWGAAHLAYDNLNNLGNARDWLWNAQRRGLPTGYMPRVGATVVYQPYVQGASWLGHVAHVVSVLSGGRFVIEEMNYQEGGGVGGFGKWSYRTSWVGAGVSFIY